MSDPTVELPSGNGLISAAFVKAQGEMPTVKFDSTNPFFKSKYASLTAVITESRPILLKHGLALQQIPIIKDGFVTVSTLLRHSSGQTIDFGSMTMAIVDTGKSEVQAAGSLVSYLRRYSWQTALGIAADEDDDGNTAPTKQQAQTKAPTKANAASRMQALNQLQAAPGQPNRDTVTAFLMYRGWLGIQNDPETWLFAHVPTTKEETARLFAEIQTWDEDRHKPVATEELI